MNTVIINLLAIISYDTLFEPAWPYNFSWWLVCNKWNWYVIFHLLKRKYRPGIRGLSSFVHTSAEFWLPMMQANRSIEVSKQSCTEIISGLTCLSTVFCFHGSAWNKFIESTRIMVLTFDQSGTVYTSFSKTIWPMDLLVAYFSAAGVDLAGRRGWWLRTWHYIKCSSLLNISK